MSEKNRWIGVAVMLVTAAGTYFWWQQQEAPEAAAPPVLAVPPPLVAPQPTTRVEAAPPIQHPLEVPAPVRPLPALDESDAALAKPLSDMLGAKSWRDIFVPEAIVRRIVATVDNLPRREAPVKMWPVRPVPGWLATTGSNAELSVAPENARRYATYAAVLRAADMAALAALYREFYPLFQQAYIDLGYPHGYFNDRLIQAIDDLLATPEPAEPLFLVQEKVRYRFADADLDGRSAGQKIMLRIGVEHARSAKKKLSELRQAVALDATPSAPQSTSDKRRLAQ